MVENFTRISVLGKVISEPMILRGVIKSTVKLWDERKHNLNVIVSSIGGNFYPLGFFSFYPYPKRIFLTNLRPRSLNLCCSSGLTIVGGSRPYGPYHQTLEEYEKTIFHRCSYGTVLIFIFKLISFWANILLFTNNSSLPDSIIPSRFWFETETQNSLKNPFFQTWSISTIRIVRMLRSYDGILNVLRRNISYVLSGWKPSCPNGQLFAQELSVESMENLFLDTIAVC